MLRAQNGFNFAPYGFEAGASQVLAFDDLKKSFPNYAFHVSGVYNYSPYIPVALELQVGTLSGGSNNNKAIDLSGRAYTNSYKALMLHIDLQTGEFLDYGDSFVLNILKNFYIGAGMGFIYNSMSSIQRIDPYNKAYGAFPGKDKSLDLMVPLRFGYQIKFYNSYDEPSFAVDIGYRHNIDFGEGLDGYNDPSDKFRNNALDQYRQITIGIKFNFGDVSAYNKSIRGY